MRKAFQFFDMSPSGISELARSPQEIRRRPHHEIMFITSGVANWILDNESYAVPHQHVFIVPQNRMHQFIPSSDVRGAVIRFTNELSLSTSSFIFSQFSSIATIPIPNDELERFELLFDLIRKESEAKTPSCQFIKHLVMALIQKLEWFKRDQLNTTHNEKQNTNLIEQFLTLLEKHFSTEHQVNFYAEQMHVHSRKLSDTLQDALGKTTKEIIEERVLIESKRLLLHTTLTAKEIAHSIGFDDTSYFSKFFKRHTTQTPKQFRLSNKI